MRKPPLPSKRLACRYCGRAFAHPTGAFKHREDCTAAKPMEKAR